VAGNGESGALGPGKVPDGVAQPALRILSPISTPLAQRGFMKAAQRVDAPRGAAAALKTADSSNDEACGPAAYVKPTVNVLGKHKHVALR
jgi:hypothetical protein